MRLPRRGQRSGHSGRPLAGEWGRTSGHGSDSCHGRCTLPSTPAHCVFNSDISFASADEIGEFVAVLVSDKQGGMGWMTGSDVVVDGGYTLL